MSLEKTRFTSNISRLETVALIVIVLASIISIAQGFRNAINGGTDLQWSPTHLLSQGIDPYSVAISGNEKGKLIMSQFPPYLHLLYIVFLPFAFMSFTAAKIVWAIVNFALASTCLLMLSRYFRLSVRASLVMAALFYSSTPFRHTMGNGQTSLLCFFAFFVAWLYRDLSDAKAGLSLSLLLMKYSFAPPILLWLLIARKFRLIIISLVPLGLGWLLFSLICNESPISTLLQPLKVANIYSGGIGCGDVMTLVQTYGFERHFLGDLQVSSIFGLLTTFVAIVVLRLRAYRLSEQEIFASLGLISLLALRHLEYDYVFLAPAAALAFSLSPRRRALVFALVAFFWFGVKVLDNLNVGGRSEAIACFFALLALLALANRIGEKKPLLPEISSAAIPSAVNVAATHVTLRIPS